MGCLTNSNLLGLDALLPKGRVLEASEWKAKGMLQSAGHRTRTLGFDVGTICVGDFFVENLDDEAAP